MPTHRSDRDLSRLNLSELRSLTGAGERTIRKRLEGLEPVGQDGRTLWYPARKALSRIFLGEELNLSRERARLAKEQADKLARENALAEGEIVRASVVEGWLVTLFGAVMQRLQAMPSKAAPEAHGAATIAATEAVLRRYQHEALEELADAKWIAPPRRNGKAEGATS